MLHYSCTGSKNSGTGIVFLHGGGFSGWMWESIIGHLPEYYCVAITLPGHGLSNASKWISLEDTARQVGEIIEKELSNMDVHLVGLSLGGHVGLHVMAQHPHLTTSAILSCIIHDPLPRPKLYKALTNAMLPLSNIRLIQKFVAHRFGMAGEKMRRYLQEFKRVDKDSLKRSSLEVAANPIPENLSNVSARILVVAGAKERSITRNALASYKSVFAHTRTALIPDYGYGWSGRRPKLFANAIRAQIKNSALPKDMKAQA
ncbi:alpha/beta fold hydrolase [Hirschia litorea]|uniref:Alpha/beta fold hydrolase n=1 Tax=Hirschia litorea TaxID=1199156 RepID=A0ABW2IJ52_9PROT